AQELAICMIELWDLIDVPIDEKKPFSHLTRLLSASVDERKTEIEQTYKEVHMDVDSESARQILNWLVES
ncbi:hypothetical protein HN51_035956, partial [Arachis hypogaea]